MKCHQFFFFCFLCLNFSNTRLVKWRAWNKHPIKQTKIIYSSSRHDVLFTRLFLWLIPSTSQFQKHSTRINGGHVPLLMHPLQLPLQFISEMRNRRTLHRYALRRKLVIIGKFTVLPWSLEASADGDVLRNGSKVKTFTSSISTLNHMRQVEFLEVILIDLSQCSSWRLYLWDKNKTLLSLRNFNGTWR